MRLASIIIFLLVVPAITSLCSKTQTEDYLTEGTHYISQAKEVDYVIVLDKSGSMEGEKLAKVKQAAKVLIDLMPETDRAAVISFSYDATIEQSLTTNHDELYKSIDAIKAGFSTRYLPPLYLAEQQFATSNRVKALIFLSDGKSDYADSAEDILALTEDLSKEDVCILTISYAIGDEESPLLVAMAETGKRNGCGNTFIASEKGTELEGVFSSIHETFSSTNILSLDIRFTKDTYTAKAQSTINAKSAPGSSSAGCADEPVYTTTILKGNMPVKTLNGSAGSFSLPDGLYAYQSTALLSCGGECVFIGKDEGQFVVGNACQLTYQDLATYITGETQTVQITDTDFIPKTISGKQGTLIVWNNNDIKPRRIKSDYFDKIIQPGSTFTHIIENTGTLFYSDPDQNITGSLVAVQGTGTDLLLVIDESGSMKGAGISETRLAAQELFNLLSPEDRGALLTFSQAAFLVRDFTSDKEMLYASILKLQSEGATNYLSALTLAQTVRRTQYGVIVFMSDGMPTDPEGEQPILDAAAALRKQGWCFITIGFGEEGIAAKNLLNRMAGDDDCSTFFYAASGQLAEVFGTVYQLSNDQRDLIFTNMHVPRITLKNTITLQTDLETKTGKPVPDSSGASCSKEATVLVRTSRGATTLTYNQTYTGSLELKQGIQTVRFIASIAASDEPGRPFIGTKDRVIIVVPPLLLSSTTIIVLLCATLIYLHFSRKR